MKAHTKGKGKAGTHKPAQLSAQNIGTEFRVRAHIEPQIHRPCDRQIRIFDGQKTQTSTTDVKDIHPNPFTYRLASSIEQLQSNRPAYLDRSTLITASRPQRFLTKQKLGRVSSAFISKKRTNLAVIRKVSRGFSHATMLPSA